MKYEFNWPKVFEKTMFNTLKGLQYERPLLKGQRLTLTLGIYL